MDSNLNNLIDNIPESDSYKLTFIDQFGRKMISLASSKQDIIRQIQQYGSYYKEGWGWSHHKRVPMDHWSGVIIETNGKKIRIPGYELPGRARYVPPPQSDQQTYKVVFHDSTGDVVYNAQTKQQAIKLVKKYYKTYGDSKIFLVTPNSKVEQVTVRTVKVPVKANVKANNVNTNPNPPKPKPKETQKVGLELDGALHRAASDNQQERIKEAEAYTWELIRKGVPADEIAEKVHQKFGVQASVANIKFTETPEAAEFKAAKKVEEQKKAIKQAEDTANSIIFSQDSVPEASVIYELSKAGKSLENKAEQLNKEALNNPNPVIAYGEALGAALLGAAAGVAELPMQTAELGVEAVKHPVKTAEQIVTAPVNAVREAIDDIKSGNAVDYGKLIGQTFAAGEVADEAGLTPTKIGMKVWDKLPDRFTSPVESLTEKVKGKLNDAVKSLTEYKPIKTEITVETPEGVKTIIAENPKTASIATIKDIGEVKSIKPVSAVVAETAFKLRTEPYEDFVVLRDALDEDEDVKRVKASEIKKVKSETAEGTAFTKTKFRLGYELETENPINKVRIETEYANKLSKIANKLGFDFENPKIVSEVDEDSVRVVLRKEGYVKGYGIKTLDSVPLQLNQEDFGVPRLLGEAKEVIPEEPPTIDLRDLDEAVSEIDTIKEKSSTSTSNPNPTPIDSINSNSQLELINEEVGSRLKVFDLSEEFSELENVLNEKEFEFEIPDELKDLFNAGKDFGSDLLDLAPATAPATMLTPKTNAPVKVEANPEELVKANAKTKPILDTSIKPDIKPDVKPTEKSNLNFDVDVIPDIGVTPDVDVDVTTQTLTKALTATVLETPTKTKAKAKHDTPEPPLPSFFLPGGGGEEFYRIFGSKGKKTKKGVKVNPIVNDPLKFLWG